jgi:hypothetical protein
MLHTIQEAMQLTGLTRKSLYNHMDSGRVSYSVEPDGRRYFQTAELERAYGRLKSSTHTTVKEILQPYTPPALPVELAQIIEDAVHRATAPLVAEIAELRATLMRIEWEPGGDTPATAPATPQPDQVSAASQSPVADRTGQSDHAPAVQSFADLLSIWE